MSSKFFAAAGSDFVSVEIIADDDALAVGRNVAAG
jgi:hypothetical protein